MWSEERAPGCAMAGRCGRRVRRAHADAVVACPSGVFDTELSASSLDAEVNARPVCRSAGDAMQWMLQ